MYMYLILHRKIGPRHRSRYTHTQEHFTDAALNTCHTNQLNQYFIDCTTNTVAMIKSKVIWRTINEDYCTCTRIMRAGHDRITVALAFATIHKVLYYLRQSSTRYERTCVRTGMNISSF